MFEIINDTDYEIDNLDILNDYLKFFVIFFHMIITK